MSPMEALDHLFKIVEGMKIPDDCQHEGGQDDYKYCPCHMCRGMVALDILAPLAEEASK